MYLSDGIVRGLPFDLVAAQDTAIPCSWSYLFLVRLVSIADRKCDDREATKLMRRSIFVRYRTIKTTYRLKKEAARKRPESREETPKEGIQRQVAASSAYGALHKKQGQKLISEAKAPSWRLSATA